MKTKKNILPRFTIGIDIGKHGAICIQEKDKEISNIKMPMIKTELDYQSLYDILTPYEGGNGLVIFEKLGVIFGSAKQTAFSMGHQAGAVEMACIALSIPFIKVPPKLWQKEMFIGVAEIKKSSKKSNKNTRDTKAMALIAAKRLFPKLKLTFGSVAKVPHDGLVDALLMSQYGITKYT